jgi:hypothetical protein
MSEPPPSRKKENIANHLEMVSRGCMIYASHFEQCNFTFIDSHMVGDDGQTYAFETLKFEFAI